MSSPLHRGGRSDTARALQAATNRRLQSRGLASLAVKEDGVIGTRTLEAVRKAAWALGALSATYDAITANGEIPVGVQRMIRNPGLRTDAQLERAAKRMAQLRRQRKRREAAAAKEHATHGTSSRSRAVNAFLAKVGTREQPPSSNGGGIITVMQTFYGFGRVPWCGISEGYHAVKFGGMIGLRSDVASVAAIENHARAGHQPYGHWQDDIRGLLPGSFLVIGGFGVHTAMKVDDAPGGGAKTVEGNCLAADEPVLTPDGWAPIASLSIGDQICDPEGGLSLVRGVYPNGVQEVYEVVAGDGASVRATADHLWTVGCGGGTSPSWQTITTAEVAAMIGRGLRVRLPSIAPQTLRWPDLPLDPYLLGALLGDGSLTGCTPMVTTNDAGMVSEIEMALPSGAVAVATEDRRNGTGGVRLSRKQGRGGNDRSKSVVTDALIDLDLMGRTAPEKFVPNSYKWARPDQRLALLQGLMDADGSIDHRGRAEFCSTSRVLAEDVQFLVRSLGGRVTLCERGAVTYTSPAQSEPKAARTAYVLRNIRLPGMSLFRLLRKKQRELKRLPGGKQWSIRSAEPAGTAEVVCIETSAPSRLYLTRGLIPTHNTSFGPGGSQSNGGCIAARVRSNAELRGGASMNYPNS